MTQDKTLYGLDIKTQWEKILEIHALNLAKKHHPDWYRWRLTNNYERAVFLNGDPVHARETTRYLWANRHLLGERVLEVGCSTGYGSQFLPNSIEYVGLDYDPIIINVAREQEWGLNRFFKCFDINHHHISNQETIIAFEVIEHLSNGLEVVERLKRNCKRLLISVPHNEPVGFWGEHHKLHGLTEQNFPGAQFAYISEHGYCTEQMIPVSETNKFNLMLCRFDQ
jgi:2-polyprenyl-3-methyl-5-hydroxy-6-metoxy-1,4-benzoquinol methylase